MHLQPKPDAFLLVHIQNRIPASGEVRVALLHDAEIVGREGIDQVPDARTSEAVDLEHTKLGSRAGRVGNFLGGALPDTLGLAIAPHMIRHDACVASIDVVANRL